MNKISSVFQHIVSSFTSHHGNKPYSVPERCILHNVWWLINRNECSVWSKPLQTQQSGVSVVIRGLGIGLGYHSPPLSGTLDISWFCRCTSYCSQGSGFSHDWLEFIETSAVMIVALAITLYEFFSWFGILVILYRTWWIIKVSGNPIVWEEYLCLTLPEYLTLTYFLAVIT